MHACTPCWSHPQLCTRREPYNVTFETNKIQVLFFLLQLLMFLCHFLNDSLRNVNSLDGTLVVLCHVFTEVRVTTTNDQNLILRKLDENGVKLGYSC